MTEESGKSEQAQDEPLTEEEQMAFTGNNGLIDSALSTDEYIAKIDKMVAKAQAKREKEYKPKPTKPVSRETPWRSNMNTDAALGKSKTRKGVL